MKRFICTVCGYTYEGEQPPDKCPVCQQPKEKFKEDISKIENMEEICLKAKACYLIYKNFDKDALAYSDFDKFAVIVREKKLYEKILDKIKKCGNNLKIKQLAEYTAKELNSIISEFN